MAVTLSLPDIRAHCQATSEASRSASSRLVRQGEVMARLGDVIAPAAASIPLGELSGHVVDVSGLCVSVAGLADFAGVGDHIRIRRLDGQVIKAEIIAFRREMAVAMPYEAIEGIGAGSAVFLDLYSQKQRAGSGAGGLAVNAGWIGRVVDPLGQPLDGKGPLVPSAHRQKRHGSPPPAASRARLGPRLDLGIKAMDLFTTCREGQRLGLFAGSGVGKSTLMGMLARETACDVAVISLVGERGREVREFIEDDLGPEGLARSVLVVATSDSSALMRREAAYGAMAVAEYFRDQGKSVLLLMDSVTRFCQALREIGLSAGEVPATRGYPPSVFATLPRLLERAGPGCVPTPAEPASVEKKSAGKAGQMTALFSVLVEGDDQNEPVTDTVRGILDGHVVLERAIAEAGRYPAINVLRSLSRAVPGCNSEAENELIRSARHILAQWEDLRDLVRLGAYKPGNDAAADRAVQLGPQIEEFLGQKKTERVALADAFTGLAQILAVEDDNGLEAMTAG